MGELQRNESIPRHTRSDPNLPEEWLNPALNYYVVFTARDPYVLGIGFAAFRDVGSFFKNKTQDDFGNAESGGERDFMVIGRGRSQSGNF